jgi:hypothetical protein
MTDKRHCDLCGSTVSKTNWAQHCKSKKHKKKVEEHTKQIKKSTEMINDKDEIIRMKDLELKLLREQMEKQEKQYKEEIERQTKQIQQLQEENSKLKQTTIINNTQNIVNVVYGKEEYKNMISLDDWDDINGMRKGMNRTKKVLRIAFGKQPTLKIPNIKDPYVDVVTEDGIKKEYQPPIIQEIIDKLPKTLKKIFTNFFEEQRHEYHPEAWKQDKAHADNIVQDIIKQTKENPKQMTEVIKTILYNNKLFN